MLTKERKPKKENTKSKVHRDDGRKKASRSLKIRMEMVQWRKTNQEEIDNTWKKLSGKIEEEVLEKYKVEGSKRGAYKGRGQLSEWRMVQRVKNYQRRK